MFDWLSITAVRCWWWRRGVGLVIEAMANWFVIECVWSFSSPFHSFPLYLLGGVRERTCPPQLRASFRHLRLHPATLSSSQVDFFFFSFFLWAKAWRVPHVGPFVFLCACCVSVEYWALFILVVAASSRRAMADNPWSDRSCSFFLWSLPNMVILRDLYSPLGRQSPPS